MNPADRDKCLALLAQGRTALLDSVSGISEEQAAMRPDPNRWSVLECVEHVAITEDRLLRFLTSQPRPAPSSDEPSREELFMRLAADRGRKFKAPDFVQPTGRFDSLAVALDEFLQARARVADYIERCPDDLRARGSVHPAIGPVTGQEFFVILALHPARHAEQIRELRQSF
jgi:hypothetical protein